MDQRGFALLELLMERDKMADAHKVQHDYHLVDPSPWPFVGAASALVLAIGAIGWMHHSYAAAPLVFGAGAIGVLYTMLSWWRDVTNEAQNKGDHTRVVQISHRYGMILFIASEVMFFVAWFWAYFNTALFPADLHQVARAEFIGQTWPPKGIETFDPWHLPLLNTLILLTSGTTVTWAHHALLEGDRDGVKKGLWLTIALGVLFTCVQAYEYSHAAFGFKGNIYGATFFMATGFHGAHVLIGTIFLIVCLARTYAGHFTPKQHLGFEFAAWYWHFVDVVWIFLFFCIYVWGAGPASGGGAH
jgi:cytochrome c oxidase subunit 3